MSVVFGASACGTDPGGDCPDTGCATGDAETPPTGDAQVILDWLASGQYKSWACEPTLHDARRGSGHPANRICSNALLSGHGDGEYPVGAASVKELYYDGVSVSGYAIALKTGTGQGEAWSWFEQVENGDVIANGTGTSGAPKSLCADCHSGAGVGDNTGHDFVFTQVE